MSRQYVRALLIFVLALWASPALAGPNLSWVGTVTAANSKQVNVLANQKDQIFLIGGDFKGVFANGKQHTTKYLKKGMYVRVAYRQAALFGAFNALEIDVFGAGLNLPVASPKPGVFIPTAAPGKASPKL